MEENEGVWAIMDDYRFRPIEVTRETAATVFYKQWNADHTKFIERRTQSAIAWRGSKLEAESLSEKLLSVRAERDRRQREATNWYRKRLAELTSDSD